MLPFLHWMRECMIRMQNGINSRNKFKWNRAKTCRHFNLMIAARVRHRPFDHLFSLLSNLYRVPWTLSTEDCHHLTENIIYKIINEQNQVFSPDTISPLHLLRRCLNQHRHDCCPVRSIAECFLLLNDNDSLWIDLIIYLSWLPLNFHACRSPAFTNYTPTALRKFLCHSSLSLTKSQPKKIKRKLTLGARIQYKSQFKWYHWHWIQRENDLKIVFFSAHETKWLKWTQRAHVFRSQFNVICEFQVFIVYSHASFKISVDASSHRRSVCEERKKNAPHIYAYWKRMRL